jgi:hypothetical protein
MSDSDSFLGFPRSGPSGFLVPAMTSRKPRFRVPLSTADAEHSFLIRANTRQHLRKHAPLMSTSSAEDRRFVAIIRRRLTLNDALPPLKTCGIA